MNDYQNNEKGIALITGASKGLGFVLADFLATRGYHVILTARHEDQLEAAAGQIGVGQPAITTLTGDVTDPDHRRQILESVRQYGRLDILVNNASTLGPLPMPDLTSYPLEGLRRAFEVNTLAPVALVQLLQPFLATGQGLVVNLSSDAAVGAYQGWGGYGASKAALDLISQTLAKELQTENIAVVSVDPGDMRTAMHQAAFPGEDISDRPLPETTLPFWAWLFGQDPAVVSGQRFMAQSERWRVLA
jgi:NAD(P)-dependent dehydrogenase (short-subunit alcohol dehydrogenase family)